MNATFARGSKIVTGTVDNGACEVTICGDAIRVATTAAIEAAGYPPVRAFRRVEGLGAFLWTARDLRLAYGATPDDAIVYVYDAADEGFGYALNLTAAECSEWGYVGTVAH